jgi:hypothetical protein
MNIEIWLLTLSTQSTLPCKRPPMNSIPGGGRIGLLYKVGLGLYRTLFNEIYSQIPIETKTGHFISKSCK